jgi:poly-gamma-glutamate capsule biosynthesis protein CapA/YwtB (metallophosphatase superfamily)
MLKTFRIIVPLTALLLGSCFVSRQTASEPASQPSILIVDPVKTALGTVTLAPGKGVIRDTVPVISAGTLRKAVIATDIFPLMVPDTMIVSGIGTGDRLFDTITIIGTGDIMPGTNYPDSSYLPPGNDCRRLFAPVADILRSADITFGNLEGVFSSEGGTPKNCRDPKTCYVFRMPDEYLDCILDAGYNLLSVANNHVNDFGTGGRRNTARLLEAAGVPFAGFVEKPSTTFEVDGVKYGFAAFAPNLGTADITDYAGAARIVAGLDSVCDIVIVSFHGGAEGRDYQHVPCTDEVYLGHNRGNVCQFAHAVVDAGADVVFGHGPHVTRAMELYKDRLICYSLGNFCTYARFNLSGPNGYAPIVKVQTNRTGKFLGGKVIPVYQPRPGGPRIDAGNHAVRLLRELTTADFPDTQLMILEDGTLKKR